MYNYDDFDKKDSIQKNNKIFWGIVILCSLIIIVLLIVLFIKKGDSNKTNYLSLNQTYLSLTEGEHQKLEISSSDDEKSLTWESDSDSVVVDENGNIYAKKAGEANITVTSSDGKTATCKIIISEDNTKTTEKIEIEKIELNITEKELKEDDTFKLQVTITPNNATNKNLTWTSSNTGAVIVTDNNIKASGIGESIVTVTTENGLKASCKVKVIERDKPVTKIKLEPSSKILNIGDSFELSVNFTPTDATNKETKWVSSDSSVATVNNGKIVALKSGITIITAESNEKYSSSIIIVKDPNSNAEEKETNDNNDSKKTSEIKITSIKLDKKSAILNINETLKLNVTINPTTATNKTLTWSSSNPSVASVKNGVITAKSVGKTIITVISLDGAQANCEIIVEKIEIKTFDQRNDAVIYYDNMTIKDIKAVDKKFKCSKSKPDCDTPKIYKTSLSGNIKIYEYDISLKTKAYIKTVDSSMIAYSMVPNVVYYLESESNTKQHEYVKILGDLRMIKVAELRNIRDLGGYEADGGVIKYGKLYRGANPNNSKYEKTITNIFNELEISVIFDLRESSSFSKSKKILSSFEKMNSDTGYYLSSKKYANTRTSVKKIMQQIVNNKGVYFHCAVGTDRTGTVANLLEGILGVPKEIRLNDFELSYFYKHYSATNRNADSIKRIYTKVSSFGGKNDQEKYINWFLSDSKDLDEDIKLINDFRASMIDGYPTEYKVQNKKCVAI